MAYQLVYTRRAVRDIRRLDGAVRQRLKAALEKYRDDPLLFARKLTNPEQGTYRFKIGDYRVVFDMDGIKLSF